MNEKYPCKFSCKNSYSLLRIEILTKHGRGLLLFAAPCMYRMVDKRLLQRWRFAASPLQNTIRHNINIITIITVNLVHVQNN